MKSQTQLQEVYLKNRSSNRYFIFPVLLCCMYLHFIESFSAWHCGFNILAFIDQNFSRHFVSLWEHTFPDNLRRFAALGYVKCVGWWLRYCTTLFFLWPKAGITSMRGLYCCDFIVYFTTVVVRFVLRVLFDYVTCNVLLLNLKAFMELTKVLITSSAERKLRLRTMITLW